MLYTIILITFCFLKDSFDCLLCAKHYIKNFTCITFIIWWPPSFIKGLLYAGSYIWWFTDIGSDFQKDVSDTAIIKHLRGWTLCQALFIHSGDIGPHTPATFPHFPACSDRVGILPDSLNNHFWSLSLRTCCSSCPCVCTTASFAPYRPQHHCHVSSELFSDHIK